MTGEITLRGQVLPVGGIKDKVLAAHRLGVDTVILPKKNENDLDDLPEEVRDKLHFVLVDQIDQALDAALGRMDSRSRNRYTLKHRFCARPAEPLSLCRFFQEQCAVSKILIVEDDATSVKLLKILLEEVHGFRFRSRGAART